ncbi:inositol monophosphatase family protein [Leucobacter sp. G161]|uniref:inositol monophosphatase family protein n=1 Tax=Leucobacter sp. G161 TaxID=663704 RepID=UPI00073C4636|nr:inositol monophosphatase family protein [Leucobacter sp. G161]KUF08137.1 inositol monophosphatase [Leucobacter sp. G161]
MTESVTASALVDIAGSLARSVGQMIHEKRAAGVDVAATKSSLTDVVTEADREAERLLTEGLRSLRPEDAILGEEGASVAGTSGVTWVLDPIDGTVNYLYNLPAYAVSVAATVTDGAPGTMSDGRRAIAGAVYVPTTGELFTAWHGGGAYLDGARLSGPAETELLSTLLATGFGYTVERRTEQVEVLRQVLPRVRDIRRMGSAAVDLCMLAAGRLDAYYERGLQPWDYAAAALIARESGAVVRGLGENAPGEELLIAGTPAITAELAGIIAEAYRTLQ